MRFEGFKTGREKLTPLPETFFIEILPQIDALGELKLILYAFWFLNRQPEDMQYLTPEDLQTDPKLLQAFTDSDISLDAALALAVEHNVLIRVETETGWLYFPNTPRGRASARALQHGAWQPEPESRPMTHLEQERPNIFQLYEENIGPLTPLMGETLTDAESTYPQDWIEDAIKRAVENNVRNWRYIDAILKSWQKEGRSEKDRRDAQEDRKKYIHGDYSDIIEH